MKLNENLKIVGENVILIPYESKFVEKYHNWMKDPDLQILTASEPLSLEEEHEMQIQWREDEDKCTFLVISKEIYERTNDEIQSLIGDTNLFIYDDYDNTNDVGIDDIDLVLGRTSSINGNDNEQQEEQQQQSSSQENNDKLKFAEAEIMIAEKTERGKHYGWEAMLLMLHYGYKDIQIKKFIVKIGMDNLKSINMFKKMQFIEIIRSNVFKEITLERKVTNDWIEWLEKQIKYVRETYNK